MLTTSRGDQSHSSAVQLSDGASDVEGRQLGVPLNEPQSPVNPFLETNPFLVPEPVTETRGEAAIAAAAAIVPLPCPGWTQKHPKRSQYPTSPSAHQYCRGWQVAVMWRGLQGPPEISCVHVPIARGTPVRAATQDRRLPSLQRNHHHLPLLRSRPRNPSSCHSLSPGPSPAASQIPRKNSPLQCSAPRCCPSCRCLCPSPHQSRLSRHFLQPRSRPWRRRRPRGGCPQCRHCRASR